jgi:hypothetical protein
MLSCAGDSVENVRLIDLGSIVQRTCAAKSGSGAHIDVELKPGSPRWDMRTVSTTCSAT